MPRPRPGHRRAFVGLVVGLLPAFTSLGPREACALVLPAGFEPTRFVGGLRDPNAMAFAPDGRLFVGERITGQLRVVRPDGRLLPEPFVTVSVPPEIPGRREEAAAPGFVYPGIYYYGSYRSSGLEGIAFDPDFEENGYIYVYFMNDFPRRNRVSRFTASRSNPNVAEPGSERVLLDIPMHTQPTAGPVPDGGSHNGGALLLGPDGKLYVTVGDGWDPAPRDGPQDLSLLIGKVLRINKDGSIPEDNPFVDVPGARPEIWALGFRNPYTASVHPETPKIYINDVVWGKQTVYELVKGGNYGHPFDHGIGERQSPVHAGIGLIAGGAWYVADAFPEMYVGNYFLTDWRAGVIRRMISDRDPQVVDFATGAHQAGQIQVGPDGALYWLSTNYETLDGAVYRIQFVAGSPIVETPTIAPDGGRFDQPVEVSLACSTPGAEIRYTLNRTEPTTDSPRYQGPIVLHGPTTVKARAFREAMHPSATAVATFALDESVAPGRGLEGLWPLDDGQGELARDLSGLGRHGRLHGRVGWQANDGASVAALTFDGGHIDLGGLDIERPALTLSAWVLPFAFLSGMADNRILSKAIGDAEQDHFWMLSTVRQGDSVTLRFRLKTDGWTGTLIAGTGALQPGVWSHVAATYDGQAMRLYLNGEEVGSRAKTGIVDTNPKVPVWIGDNPLTAEPRPFRGALRQVRIDPRALSADEIRDLRDRTAPLAASKRSRTELIATFQPALTRSGDPQRGRKVFVERCVDCHRLEDRGSPLGPDLSDVARLDKPALLTAILDPSREVAPEYWTFLIETRQGEVLQGLITDESDESITLQPVAGEPITVTRSDIRVYQRLESSLMPEGLDAGLAPDDLSDLLEFLKTHRSSSPTATEEPRPVVSETPLESEVPSP